MKTIKYLILGVFILVLILDLAYSQRIDVKISIPKTSFLEKESIFLITEIKNITNENIEIERPYVQTGSVEMKVKSSKGKSDDCRVWSGGPNKFILMAGMFKILPLNLTSYYGMSQENRSLKYFSEGIYTVHAIYYTDERRLEKYESNELIFNVEKPKGNEVPASEEYTKGYCEFWNDNYKKSAEIFEEFCNNFPNSIYVPDGYGLLHNMYARYLKDTTRATYFAERLLDYPNNVGVSVVIPFLSNEYSKVNKKYMMDSIQQNHKNTFLERIIDDYKNYLK
jgi:hypothetical protein